MRAEVVPKSGAPDQRSPLEIVLAVRTSLYLKQHELGMLLGVHGVTISRWETGKGEPSSWHLSLLLRLEQSAGTQRPGQLAQILNTSGPIEALGTLLQREAPHAG